MKIGVIKTALTFMICLVAVTGVSAQGLKDVRINEFLVKNVDSYEDDYGHRVGWIELFNAGHSQVDVGGAYLKVRGKEYRIPKNDPRTKIAPQGYVIFFAEGTASKGTFHTNFKLDETDYVTLYDQSGRVMIDSIYYNIDDMKEDVSVGWYETHDGKMHFGELAATTPMAVNDTEERVPRSELFRQEDPTGGVMTITAMAVVFTALWLLCFVFKGTGKFFIWLGSRKEQRNKLNVAQPASQPEKKKGSLSHDEMAAIAIALYKYSENLHDIENTVLTINRVARAYSPWSSKIYGLRETPNKK